MTDARFRRRTCARLIALTATLLWALWFLLAVWGLSSVWSLS